MSKVFYFMMLMIALPLPATVQTALQRLCHGLPDTDWTDPSHLHIALHTIHKIDGNTFLDIKESLASLTPFPLSITLQGIGCNFTKRKSGSLWVEVQMTPALEQLLKEIAKVLKHTDIPTKQNHFKPEIILGRFTSLSPQRLADYLEANNSFSLPSFEVNSLLLIHKED